MFRVKVWRYTVGLELESVRCRSFTARGIDWGECFIKVNERRPRPIHWPCPSLSACYPVTLQMCKSPSPSHSLVSLLPRAHDSERESASETIGESNKIPCGARRSRIRRAFLSPVMFMTACAALNTSLARPHAHPGAKLL